MSPENTSRRMTLRQIITHAEKCSRGVIEHVHSTMLLAISDFRDLSRPVRRRSHYPTLVAIQHALQELKDAADEVAQLTNDLDQQLGEIDDRAKKERVNRL